MISDNNNNNNYYYYYYYIYIYILNNEAKKLYMFSVWFNYSDFLIQFTNYYYNVWHIYQYSFEIIYYRYHIDYSKKKDTVETYVRSNKIKKIIDSFPFTFVKYSWNIIYIYIIILRVIQTRFWPARTCGCIF